MAERPQNPSASSPNITQAEQNEMDASAIAYLGRQIEFLAKRRDELPDGRSWVVVYGGRTEGVELQMRHFPTSQEAENFVDEMPGDEGRHTLVRRIYNQGFPA